METTPTQRVIHYFTTRKVPRKKVTEVVTVSRQAVANWFNGQNEMRMKQIEQILDAFPGLNPNWVWSGSGPMEISDSVRNTNQLEVMQAEENQSDYGQSREDCIEQLARANKIIDNLLKQIDDIKKK